MHRTPIRGLCWERSPPKAVCQNKHKIFRLCRKIVNSKLPIHARLLVTIYLIKVRVTIETIDHLAIRGVSFSESSRVSNDYVIVLLWLIKIWLRQ